MDDHPNFTQTGIHELRKMARRYEASGKSVMMVACLDILRQLGEPASNREVVEETREAMRKEAGPDDLLLEDPQWGSKQLLILYRLPRPEPPGSVPELPAENRNGTARKCS